MVPTTPQQLQQQSSTFLQQPSSSSYLDENIQSSSKDFMPPKMSSTNPSDQQPIVSNSSSNRKETFCLVTLIIILLIISIVTTITLLVIIYRLRLVPGFEFFTIIDDNVIIHKDTFIDRIILGKNRISGLKKITGNIALESGHSSLKLNNDGIHIRSKYGLEIRSINGGQLLYPFDISSLPLNNIKTLSVPNGIKDVKMIRSPLDEDLHIEAKENIRIRGNEGVNIEGKHVRFDAKNIFLSSVNSSIIMDGYKGIYLDMNAFKNRIVTSNNNRAQSSSSSSSEDNNLQYKLCICGRNGKLFRMAIKDSSSSCADARFPQSDNPCL